MTDILAGKIGNTFNIHSKSRDETARLLSNFANRPFEIDGAWMASVEGFVQGIKFEPDDNLRYRAFASAGSYAKKFGAAGNVSIIWLIKPVRTRGYATCMVAYGSIDHHSAIDRAIEEKFLQNPDCMEALFSTKGLILTHTTGEPESPHTSLPAKLFCKILTRIREENG